MSLISINHTICIHIAIELFNQSCVSQRINCCLAKAQFSCIAEQMRSPVDRPKSEREIVSAHQCFQPVLFSRGLADDPCSMELYCLLLSCRINQSKILVSVSRCSRASSGVKATRYLSMFICCSFSILS